ncbi:restriction endonuclease subunit S [Campylobacter blaseri]|nr:restriction endonuclease subunit S [Campylobacter blaseri]PSM53500.1 hypothetical protein CRN67_06135 [Campylobacter blaseri]
MAKISYVEKQILDICDIIPENHKYTKNYINNNKGEYPVYSANTNMPFGYISDYDFENEEVFCVVNYGDSGKTYNITTNRFSIGRNVCGVKIKEEYKSVLSLEFIRLMAEQKFLLRVKGSKQKNLNQTLVKTTEINIPVNEDGDFDIEKQKEIVKKYNIIEDKKLELKEKLDYINSVEVDFMASNEEKRTIILPFEELFEIERGKVISQMYINNNKGDYPVYSTQLDMPFGYINNFMYDGKYLIWNTDGLGGYIRNIEGKFSITNIVGIMKLKSEYYDTVNLEYIRRILQPIFRQNTKGREGIKGKNEYTKINSTMIKNLNIKIEFPATKDGKIDLDKQNAIVKKYDLIDEMKQKITDKGLPFTLANVELDGLTPYIYIYIYI